MKTATVIEWWTVKEVAEHWRISDDTVMRMISRDELKAQKFGGQWRIHRSVIEAFEKPALPSRTRSRFKPAAEDVLGRRARVGGGCDR